LPGRITVEGHHITVSTEPAAKPARLVAIVLMAAFKLVYKRYIVAVVGLGQGKAPGLKF